MSLEVSSDSVVRIDSTVAGSSLSNPLDPIYSRNSTKVLVTSDSESGESTS